MKYRIEFELPDNETVFKEIETEPIKWSIWGYSGYAYASAIARDAQELLKEQEPVKVVPLVEQVAVPLTQTSCRVLKKYYCGTCKQEITGNNVYCHRCGQAVKWNGFD